MTFLDDDGNPVSEFITREGGVVNTADLDGQFTLVPPVLEVTKSGPATMTIGQSGHFAIDVRNTGPNDAWNTTIRDVLPNGATGGMCDTTPQVLSAQVFAADGVTPVPGKGPLLAGTDFALSYAGAPTCELTLAMLTPAAAIGPDERLIITYRSQLDADTQNGVTLTNVAGATEWFDDEPSNPDRVTFTRTLTDGTRRRARPRGCPHGRGLTNASLFAAKNVAILVDNGTPNVVDPGDVLRYTITIHNSGGVAATGVTLKDSVPANTTYVADSTTLNGLPVGQPDGGVSPLVAGIPISSADLTPPLPGPGAGTISPGATAVLEFQLRVNAGVPGGTLISNQAVVGSGRAAGRADRRRRQPRHGPGADGGRGGQRSAAVDHEAGRGGRRRRRRRRRGPRIRRDRPEHRVRAGLRRRDHGRSERSDAGPARLCRLVGDAEWLAERGDGRGVAHHGQLLRQRTARLPPNASVVLRFRATLAANLAMGTIVTNTGVVTWNTPQQTASASVSISVGGAPGVGALNGTVWHDADFDNALGASERLLEGWIVELYQGGALLQSVLTDANGTYTHRRVGAERRAAVSPTSCASGPRTRARTPPSSAGPTPSFTNGLQQITDIVVPSGSNLQNLDLPIDPNGVVYASIQRAPVAGATLTLLDASGQTPLPSLCFDDPVQQGQVTRSDGYYKFDLNFSDPACASGGSYLIAVTPPGSNFAAGVSQVIPPTVRRLDGAALRTHLPGERERRGAVHRSVSAKRSPRSSLRRRRCRPAPRARPTTCTCCSTAARRRARARSSTTTFRSTRCSRASLASPRRRHRSTSAAARWCPTRSSSRPRPAW